MSVAALSTEELALFSAVVTHLDILPFPAAVKLSALISEGNAAAWSATYSDTIATSDADEIEAIALRKLARKDFVGHFGPLAYNMVSNNGRAFAGIFQEIEQGDDILGHIQTIEKAATKFIESEARKAKRAEEGAARFDDIPRQPKHSADEVRQACRDAGMQRVIYATYNCDESDGYSDYWGGRTTRTIVIGFGKGKRENFKQLRKAAGVFPPTAHMGPGCDASLENRENYSMGGGNYLGHSRYSGWKVQSVDVDWNCGLPESVEWFKAEEEVKPKAKRVKRGRKAGSKPSKVVEAGRAAEVVELDEVGCMAEDWV